MSIHSAESPDMRAARLANAFTLGAKLARFARQKGDSPAITVADASRTYTELDERANAVAAALAARGVGHGDRVAMLAHNSIHIVEVVFAAARLGAIAVPINFRLTAPEVAFILGNCSPKVVATDGILTTVARDAVWESGISAAVWVWDAVGGVATDDFDEFERVTAAPAPAPDVDVSSEEALLIMYTSGTTGRPKGAVLTHQNALLNGINGMLGTGVNYEGSTYYAGVPLFHGTGMSGVINYISVGAHIIMPGSETFSAADTADTMERERVNACFFVPTQWKALTQVPNIGHKMRFMQRGSWGASPAALSTLQAMSALFPHMEILSGFGQTETSPTISQLRGEYAISKMGSVGPAVPGVEARIIDADGKEVGVGEVGEIVYRGPTMMKEYWDNPEATAAAFRDGWFHSGDLCTRDEDGFITVVDRIKDMIISGGENIYCAEVENAIDAHPGVADVAVVGAPHPKWVETPVAVVVPKDLDNPPTEGEIIEFCKDRIASYKKPTAVLFVDELPRNASGKVQKFKLRDAIQR
jgi:acyl-CoA synthetase (AMP-forming)/AMP-acid ligase II